MAKIIKFPLKMADGFGARTIEELREHADVSSIAAYYDNGKLHRWLLANYLDDNAKEIDSIKESLKSDYNKINTQKVRKIYEVLGISKVDEKELSDYLINTECPIDKTSTNCDFEIEDDASIKNEIINHIHPDTNIDDWDIACTESDISEVYQVFIENKQENIFTCFNLKKDSFFYIKIANTIYNLSISLLKEDVKDLKQYVLLKSELDNIFENHIGSMVMFGKKSWRIIKKNREEALLLCSESVTTLHYDGIQEYLENKFMNTVFSSDEKGAIVPLSDSSFNLEDTKRQYEFLYKKNNQNIFLFSRYDLNELVDLQYKQIGVYWWLVDGYVRDTGGSAYIKQSNQKGYSYGVRPAIIVSRQGLV